MYPNWTSQTQRTGLPSQNRFHQLVPQTYSHRHIQHFQQPRPLNCSGQTVNHGTDFYNFNFFNPGSYNVTINMPLGHPNGQARGHEGTRNPYQLEIQNQSHRSVGHNHFSSNQAGRSVGVGSTDQFSTCRPQNQDNHLRTIGYQQQRSTSSRSNSTPSSGCHSQDSNSESGFDDEALDYIDPFLGMLLRMRRGY